MIARQRHAVILNALARTGFLATGDAVALTGASEATVRRDFAELEQGGTARRHRGGIERVSADAPLASQPLATRLALGEEAKRLIAERAVLLCAPGDTVFVDAGSTTLHLAALLAGMPIRVITNSFAVARTLVASAGGEVLLAGGQIDRSSEVVFSYLDDPIVESYPPDVAFLSAQGVDATGVWNSDERLIRLERRVAALAGRTVLLADSSKFGVRGRIKLCTLAEIDTIVTDPGVAPDHARLVDEAGVQLIR